MKLKNPSLKNSLILQLAIPLVLFMTIESILSYFVTMHHVNSAYDRWLLDSARSLVQEIKPKNGRASVELPPAALEIFKWDDQDKTYFKITSSQGLLAGDNLLPDLPILKGDRTKPVYFDSTLYGEPVRVVGMTVTLNQIPGLFNVVVAETFNKRQNMMLDILFADLFPQILLLLGIGIYLLTGVKRGLRPLHALASEIAKRSPRDLHPISNSDIVSEVHTLIDTINTLFAQLLLAITAQERFVANAAHQLRTPLAGLKLQAERALREDNIAAMQPALGNMLNSADRLSHLTSQLLILARIEPNQYNLELRPLNLCDFTREICIDWVPKALERKIEINFECLDEKIMIRADSILLRELMNNLLDNAIAYSFDKSTIKVSIKKLDSTQLSITDEGPGIPDDELTKIFERFYRIPGSQGNGCGLGLAIVKEIAELHHIRLQLSRATPNGGTRIDLFFPI